MRVIIEVKLIIPDEELERHRTTYQHVRKQIDMPCMPVPGVILALDPVHAQYPADRAVEPSGVGAVFVSGLVEVEDVLYSVSMETAVVYGHEYYETHEAMRAAIRQFVQWYGFEDDYARIDELLAEPDA